MWRLGRTEGKMREICPRESQEGGTGVGKEEHGGGWSPVSSAE
jgi:hypothetical protein